MKTTLSTCVAGLAVLLSGSAMAGDAPKSDAPPRDLMHLDKDGDGRVSRAEAADTSAKRTGEWFDKVDQNKDGYVSKEELHQARETRHAMHDEMKGKAKERYKETDANSDGQISLDEAQAKMPKVAENFSTLDKDKNGLLSKEELKSGGRDMRGKHGKPGEKDKPGSAGEHGKPGEPAK